MHDVTWQMILIVCPLIFLAGFVDSIAGGGGLISLPAYYLAGLPPSLAGGSNKLSAVMGTTVSTITYGGRGLINYRAGIASVLGSVPGAVLGAYLLTVLPAYYIRVGVLLALPVVAFIVLKNKDLSVRDALIPRRYILPACFVIGFVIGTYDGLVGPGTGTFLILAYVMLMGEDALHASGTAKLVNLGSNVGALITLITTGHVLYALALPAAAFGIAGNMVGARLAIKKGAPFVRALLLVVLGLLLVTMLVDVISS